MRTIKLHCAKFHKVSWIFFLISNTYLPVLDLCFIYSNHICLIAHELWNSFVYHLVSKHSWYAFYRFWMDKSFSELSANADGGSTLTYDVFTCCFELVRQIWHQFCLILRPWAMKFLCILFSCPYSWYAFYRFLMDDSLSEFSANADGGGSLTCMLC